ncbi:MULTISPECIES: FHA domain-containing protein [unclassified Caballeronia]|uniref:FHA domain-containing protein n=1 Tax=unclassified Caballeronia TaxID=2646786 RepID=UPI002028B7C7|nr:MULTISPECIES: FHA domain-containing protein [unclassified Caballeronia]
MQARIDPDVTCSRRPSQLSRDLLKGGFSKKAQFGQPPATQLQCAFTPPVYNESPTASEHDLLAPTKIRGETECPSGFESAKIGDENFLQRNKDLNQLHPPKSEMINEKEKIEQSNSRAITYNGKSLVEWTIDDLADFAFAEFKCDIRGDLKDLDITSFIDFIYKDKRCSLSNHKMWATLPSNRQSIIMLTAFLCASLPSFSGVIENLTQKIKHELDIKDMDEWRRDDILDFGVFIRNCPSGVAATVADKWIAAGLEKPPVRDRSLCRDLKFFERQFMEDLLENWKRGREPSDIFWNKFRQFETSRESFIVGRDTDLKLSNPKISRRHAKVHFEDGVPYITDLSTNGTWVNGEKLMKGKAQLLIRGQAISFGEEPEQIAASRGVTFKRIMVNQDSDSWRFFGQETRSQTQDQ